MSFLRSVADFIDSINDWVGRGVAWITFLLVVVVFVDVVMRYLFSTSFVFTQELEWHLFSFVFLVGAGYTLLKDGHVRVDILYQSVGPRGKAWVNLLGVIFLALPGCFMVIDTSLDFVTSSWMVMEGSPDPGGVPYRFIVKSFIPIGFGLLLFQAISLGLRSILVLLGEDSGEESAH